MSCSKCHDCNNLSSPPCINLRKSFYCSYALLKMARRSIRRGGRPKGQHLQVTYLMKCFLAYSAELRVGELADYNCQVSANTSRRYRVKTKEKLKELRDICLLFFRDEHVGNQTLYERPADNPLPLYLGFQGCTEDLSAPYGTDSG